MPRRLLAALAACLFALPAVAQKPVSFINDVAPILKENCYACHDAKKRSGKYDMTTFEKLMAGGPGGEPITAGKPADSQSDSKRKGSSQRVGNCLLNGPERTRTFDLALIRGVL